MKTNAGECYPKNSVTTEDHSAKTGRPWQLCTWPCIRMIRRDWKSSWGADRVAILMLLGLWANSPTQRYESPSVVA